MKHGGWLISLFCALILTGCSGPVYTIEDWLVDACQEMGYVDHQVINHWQEILAIDDLQKQLTCRDAAVILCDILGEDQEHCDKVMVSLGYFSQKAIDDNEPVFSMEAKSLLEKAGNDLADRTFF